MIEITSEPRVAGLSSVIRLHRRYRGAVRLSVRRNIMRLRRPTTGDRMDNAQERRARFGQSEADRVIERAQAAQWDRDQVAARRLAEDTQPYRGSRLEARHRRRDG